MKKIYKLLEIVVLTVAFFLYQITVLICLSIPIYEAYGLAISDKKEGKGVFVSSDGEHYEGDWIGDKKNGFGENVAGMPLLLITFGGV